MLGRCATITTVRPRRASSRTVSRTVVSVASSRWAVGSSSSRTGRSAARVRTRASRCRCPSDSPLPSAPTTVSQPSGNSSSTSSNRVAAQISSSPSVVRSTPVRRRLSASVPGSSTGRWGSQATCSHHASSAVTGRPPTSTLPSAGSASPRTASRAVDLPAPFAPASTVTAPGRHTASSRCGAYPSRLATLRFVNVSSAEVASNPAPAVAEGVAAARSRIVNARSAAALPSSAAWNFAPTVRSGRYASGARISATTPASRAMSP